MYVKEEGRGCVLPMTSELLYSFSPIALR